MGKVDLQVFQGSICGVLPPNLTAMERRLRDRKLHAFLCFFLALELVQVRAVNLQDPPIIGWSCQKHCANGGLRLGASNLNLWKEPTYNVGSRRSARAGPDLLPSQIPRAQTLPSRRVATEKLTANRQEVEALMSFKAGISGGKVSLFENWDASDATPCGWVGVSCSAGVQRVSALNFGGYQLEGGISSALRALGGLGLLHSLDLSNNMLTSSISGSILQNFSSLASMNLSYNQLEGEIPMQIGDLTNLQSLAFQYNNLSGQIPSSIGNCTLLRVLNLRANLLRGQIPRGIGRFTHLEVLWLGNDADAANDIDGRYGNSLTGSIPASLGNCSSLRLLNLDLNIDLRGEIPGELSQLRSLQFFSCIKCDLEGTLGWISNLTNLVEIHLNSNNLDGTLPAEIGRLSNLSWLALGENNLTGHFPTSLANCTSLNRLRIANNYITGVIPPGLGNCSLLLDINVGRNPLSSGPIPPWLSSMPHLQIICLDETNREAEISNELVGSLPNLEWVDFSSNNLEGPIPSSLWNCTDLEILKLNGNYLTGHLSSEVGGLTNLINLLVSENYLSGSFPPSIANLTLLKDVEMFENSFTGSIGDQWGQLSLLEGIYLGENLLEGSIPSTLGNCSSLVDIVVSNNLLTGNIPASLGNLSQLLELKVWGNRLSGKVPVELAQCPQLTSLILASNQLEGTFPPEISRLPVLTEMNVSHNMLTGDIANAIGNSSQILQIDFSYNRFSGSMSKANLASFRFLESFNISHNIIAGSLFSDWSKLVSIQEIDVSANKISDTIPYLGGLQSLKTLDVSLNKFSGHIPAVLASLPHLVFFNASYNNLDGPVPAFLTPQSNITAASFLGNPGLCGEVLGPSQECQNNTSTSPRAKCEGFECARVWVPVTVAGIACILLVFAVVAWAVRRSKAARNEFDVEVLFRSNLPKVLPDDILAIIKDKANVIGTTADSVIYRGSLPGHEDMIAVKTFVGHKGNNEDPGGAVSWKNLLEQEAKLQAGLRHRNVLKLLSFCSHPSFKAMLLEYMPHGSLQDHLYANDHKAQDEGKAPKQNCELPWSIRFEIAMNVAEGMTYLHHECLEPLIHGDLKPSNVLLDKEMVAKVSDFGISRAVNPQRAGGELGDGEATVSRICGTIGYMPPEYAYVTSVSTKGDVFSYGMLLLEMLSGSPPMAKDDFGESNYRAQMLCCFQETPLELLDLALQHEGAKDALTYKQMMLLAKIAFLCTRESPQSRPSMENVRSMLKQIKGLEVEEVPLRTLYELAEENEMDLDGWERANPDPTT